MSKKFGIPQAISRDRVGDEDYEAAYSAAFKHGKQLKRAMADLGDARDHAEILCAYLIEEDYTADTAVKLIKKLLWKAHGRLDEHDSAHNNLFIAYCDLKRERSQ